MPTPVLRKTVLAAALSTLFVLPAVVANGTTAAPGPLGAEFLVNTNVALEQTLPAVAADAAGNFVVVWQTQFSAGDLDVLARRYDAQGQPRGDAFAVASLGAADETRPRVAMDPSGNFVVVWETDLEGGTLGERGILAQRFDAAGAVQGQNIQVNLPAAGNQFDPTVQMDAAGNFVVAWIDISIDRIRARRFSALGLALSEEFTVNPSGAARFVLTPAVAVAAGGDFVVAWSDRLSPERVVRAQRFSAAGVAQGGEFAISPEAPGVVGRDSAVAMDAAGNFVVAWAAYISGEDFDIRARRYSAVGEALGAEFVVNTLIPSEQREPEISLDADGAFVVAWASRASGDNDVRARRYDAAGQALGEEFAVNSVAPGFQLQAAVSADADGDFVVAWTSNAAGSNDIQARRFQGPDSVDLDLFQTDSADPAPVGAPLHYTLSVGNLRAPSALTGIAAIDSAIGAASGLRVVDILPAGSSAVSASGSDWSCTLPVGKVVCDYAQPLAAGEEANPITVTLTPPDAAGSVLSNVARAAAEQLDDNPANNRAVERTRLVCADSVIQLSLSSYTVNEAGPNAVVTATRSGGLCGAASVQIDSAAGSALAGVDFTDVTGVLSWLDGQGGNRNFSIPINDDALDELDERLTVSLSAPTGASLGSRRSARVAITDNDAAPRINFTSRAQSVSEAVGLATVTVSLSEISGRDVRVPLSLGGTAAVSGADADYFTGNRTLTIPVGSLTASTVLEIVDDNRFEPDETAILNLGAVSGATVGTLRTHTLTIQDNEPPPPTVSFTTASSSGPEGSARAVVLSLSAASAATVTVPYTLGGTADPAEFSINRPSPLSFPVGVTSLSIQINAPDSDTLDEADDTVILTLGTPTNATLGTLTTHTRIIVDNDLPPP